MKALSLSVSSDGGNSLRSPPRCPKHAEIDRNVSTASPLEAYYCNLAATASCYMRKIDIEIEIVDSRRSPNYVP